VDGGNSKADVALVARDGSLLAAVRGPTISHQQVGLRDGMARLRALVDEAARRAELPAEGEPIAELGLYCVAGADFPREVALLRGALEQSGLAMRTEVLNDTQAPLRAGTERGWGVVLICGAGVNAAGVGPTGRSARLAALGPISGDAGGGRDLGMGALGAAVRARDGRGPRTTLEQLVPAHFHLTRPEAVTRAMYDGRIEEERVRELAPVVFAAAEAGDAVARGLINRMADELVTMGVAMIRRVGLARQEFDVVLAGGVFLNHDQAFFGRLAEGIRAVAPGARLIPLRVPPVLGAALLGLDRLEPRPGAAAEASLRAAEARLRAAFTNGGTPRHV